MTNLLGTSYKLDKSNAVGAALSEPILNAVMYFAPSDSGGLGNLCPWATNGCRVVCLGIGSGRMNQGKAALDSREFDWEKTTVSKAMIWRTTLFMRERPKFRTILDGEIGALRAKAQRQGMKAAVRLNGTTDIVWEKVYPELFTKYHDVIFYDYTKAPRSVRINAPANYHLTFSYAETAANHLNALDWLKAGKNIAVVFDTAKGEALPESFLGRPVIDADLDDMRFLDAPGVVAGLRAKGAAKHDATGFVVQVCKVCGECDDCGCPVQICDTCGLYDDCECSDIG
jgi:hypothetical protein